MAISLAVEAKSEVVIWRRPQKIERALVTSYRPSIVTILTRFRDIAAFVLQHANFSHPTHSLPKICPCFPGSRWMIFKLWATKSEDVGLIGLIICVISFQDFQPMWS